jgi:AcrR family transcriptional regulator
MSIEIADRPSRWQRRKEDRPAEILGAALTCFAERGFAATRLDDVAHRAGVTKGTLYLYFPNKEELFKAVVRQELLPNIARLEALVDEAAEMPAAELLAQMIRGWAEVVPTPVSAIPKIIVGEAGNFPDLARFYNAEVVQRGIGLFRRVIGAGIERGEFHAVDLDSAVRCVVAPLLMAMLWRHSFGRHEAENFDPELLCQTHLQLLLNGLAIQLPSGTSPSLATESPAGAGADASHQEAGHGRG